MSWFKPTPQPPEPLYDAYRFDPKPDITAYELATILSRTSSATTFRPFGWVVIWPAGKPVIEPEARHFVPLATRVTMGEAGRLVEKRPTTF